MNHFPIIIKEIWTYGSYLQTSIRWRLWSSSVCVSLLSAAVWCLAAINDLKSACSTSGPLPSISQTSQTTRIPNQQTIWVEIAHQNKANWLVARFARFLAFTNTQLVFAKKFKWPYVSRNVGFLYLLEVASLLHSSDEFIWVLCWMDGVC